MKKIFFTCLASIAVAYTLQVEGAYTIQSGRLTNVDDIAYMSPERHFAIGMAALEHKDWHEASYQFNIVTVNFPETTYGQDAYFYLGVSYYELGDFEWANEAFSQYLKCNQNPKLFEEAVTYKLAIANQFRDGAKTRFFGWKSMPQWMPSESLAIEIYDEVIASMPCHDIAATALYTKARYLWTQRDYEESIGVYQQLIRRFPKHELAPQSYLAISKIYLEQSQSDIQNPDILAFEQINLKRFSQEFPREELVAEVEKDLMEMKECFAKSLFETGQYYERVDRIGASIIYYQNAIDQFPDTVIAKRCQSRLNWLVSCSKTEEKVTSDENAT